MHNRDYTCKMNFNKYENAGKLTVRVVIGLLLVNLSKNVFRNQKS